MSEGDGKERLVEWLRSGVCIRQAASHSGVEVDMRATVDLMAEAADTIASLTTQLETERERATKAEAALREKAMEYLALDQQATEALARAVKAEEERDRLRTVLLEAREDIRTYVSSRWSEFEDTPDSAVAYIDAALKTGEPSHD